MKSIILRVTSKYILPLLLLFSIFILLRGHYLPGGGFVGGLVASVAFVLHSFANSLKETRDLMRIHPGVLMPFGLAVSILSAVFPLLLSKPYMTGVWYPEPVAILGSIGTALFFDLGVYLVVVGATLTIIFTISDAE